MRRSVAFVLCPGHSGSTLLGHFLGAHARILHVGEIVAPMRRGRPFRCRVCEGPECPVWGSALSEPFALRGNAGSPGTVRVSISVSSEIDAPVPRLMKKPASLFARREAAGNVETQLQRIKSHLEAGR